MIKLKKGDPVIVIAGKDKGKISKIKQIVKKDEKVKVVVEGVNVVKKHVKAIQGVREGGIFEIEKPIDISNVAYYDETLKKPIKIGVKIIDEGNKKVKVRINKKTGQVIDKVWEKIKKEV
ncbi:50S ribosomal protein L24 [Sulfurihydrogenibium subterraneum]|uniref:50S ribosomal protein L24 n=1 Tax=Sulfurihydrogenibium subterraneum TaxID=171121 RepID=UPI00055A6D5A|nr:50S ribosomal protein L24 [Sulfurihydrogenibium subterraneum]